MLVRCESKCHDARSDRQACQGFVSLRPTAISPLVTASSRRGFFTASIPLGAEVFSQQVGNRVLLRNPALERHTTRTGDLDAIAVRRWVARIRRETSMPAMERDEFLHVIGEVHLVVTTRSPDPPAKGPSQQRAARAVQSWCAR